MSDDEQPIDPAPTAEMPWIDVVMGEVESKVALTCSNKLRREAELAAAGGELSFAFLADTSARVLQLRNKANPKVAQGRYVFDLVAGDKITLTAEFPGSDLGGAAALIAGIYTKDGTFITERRWPLSDGQDMLVLDVPERGARGTLALSLSGTGVLRSGRIVAEGRSTLSGVKNGDAAPRPSGMAYGRSDTEVGKLSLLFRNGFHERASADLARIVYDLHAPPKKRANAAFSLAASWASRSSPETGRRIGEMLGIIDVLEKPEWLGVERAMFAAESLAMVGDRAAARIGVIAAHARLRSKSRTNLEPALVNLLDEPYRTGAILDLLNRGFALAGCSPVGLRRPGEPISTANLRAEARRPDTDLEARPLVTVIVPAYNAADRLETCLRSLLDQSWGALEILVADDASTDDTAAVVERFAAADKRVRLVRQAENGGPYRARNAALGAASGEFVTTHDSDDWSHPEKIEHQVRHLVENPSVMGNMTEYLRFNDSFVFQRRGRLSYRGPCLSSFMFRRAPVTEAIGFWDAVRFGADAEFISRVEIAFGPESVARLQPAVLTLMHLGDDNLTAMPFSQYAGFKTGARKEYAEAAQHWYRAGGQLRIEAEPAARPFPVPRIMRPDYSSGSGPDRFDIILASDFRLTGGTNQSNAQEVRIARDLGLRVGLLQIDRYGIQPDAPIGDRIRDLADGEGCRFITFGEEVDCDLLAVRHPPVIAEANVYMPKVRARAGMVIVNEPPNRVRDGRSFPMYDPAACERNLRRFAEIDGETMWTPIGPVVRDAFVTAHPDFALSPETWINILDFTGWDPKPLPGAHDAGRKPVVGRHSRDHYTKWPEQAGMIRDAYVSDRFETRVMGGATVPAEILGGQPEGWTVYPFDDMPVADFLRSLDLFVYFTHTGWDEAFGRVILEALSVGLPVIAERKLKSLFGDALIYARPDEVPAIVDRLWRDPALYAERARAGAAFARERFGPAVHVARITALLDSARKKAAA